MKPQTITPIQPAPTNNRFPERTIRTLLVDDSPLQMALLVRIVSKAERVGIVGSATDGRKAVIDARLLQPDLVITDLQMPGLDGAEAARFLKQRPNPPLIFVVTSDNSPQARAKCIAAGADAFLVKSANLAQQLLSAIKKFFPHNRDSNDVQPKYLNESLTTV